jgi:hypothetical protein
MDPQEGDIAEDGAGNFLVYRSGNWYPAQQDGRPVERIPRPDYGANHFQLPNGDIVFGLSIPDGLSRLIRFHPSSQDWDVVTEAVPGPILNLVADGEHLLASTGDARGSMVTPFVAPDYLPGRVAILATLAQENWLVKTGTGGLYTVGGGGLLELTRD